MSRKRSIHQELTGDRCDNCNGAGTVIADIGGINAVVHCPKCYGTGLINSPNACTNCHGSGIVLVDMGGLKAQASCDHCNGSGLEPKTTG